MDEPILRYSAADSTAILIGAEYDRTASFGRGTARGPQAILDCLEQLELYDRISDSNPCERWKIGSHVESLNHLEPEAMIAQLEQRYRSFDGRFRLLLGGEHSVTNAPLRVLASRASEITVVQIDAHADLRPDDSDYNPQPHGEFAHCSVMRRAYDLGYSLCQVGVRAYSAAEKAMFDDPRIALFEWSAEPASDETILQSIKTESIYLSIDVDGFDPAVMPATGTPVPGGLDWYRGVSLIQALARRHQIVGADIVEVSPREGDVRTEYNAAQLAYSILGLVAP